MEAALRSPVNGQSAAERVPGNGPVGSYDSQVGTAVGHEATAGETGGTRTSGEAPEPALGRIPALDGIRAVGIALVLLFHGGVSWAGGGFFGVDVFFVLSGFLITGLLVSEFRQNSGIGLLRFWGHRVRRLVPALLALLVGVALYGIFFASPDTLGQLRGDAAATLLYVNNWHQISGGQGYFAALNTPRPLVPTWSLSIEEQFYLVWPLVVLGLLRWTRSLRVLLAVTVTGAVASAIAMSLLYDGGTGESRVYYGTDTRAQALLVGAALAIVLANPLPRRRRSGPLTTTSLVRSFAPSTPARAVLIALGGAGLGVVLWMAAVTTSASSWIYHGGFALVAVATAAVIASVALVTGSPWARALSLRPVRYLGTISYGLYLWHWPVFLVLDHDRTGLLGWQLFLTRVTTSVAIAAVSFHFLEMPIRRGALRGWRGWAATPVAIGATGVILVAATAGATPSVAALPVVPTGGTSLTANTGGDASTEAAVPEVAAGTGGPVRVLLVGDSEASFLGFGLGPASGAYGTDYAGDGVFGCGLSTNETLFHGTLVSGTNGARGGTIRVSCTDQLVRWRADLDTFHPDVVLLVEGEYEVRNQRVARTWTHIGEPAFDASERTALARAVTVLHSTGATVVLLTAPYYHQLEQPDGAAWPEDDPARVNTYNSLLRAVAAGSKGTAVVADLNARLDPGGHYDQTVNGIDVRFADGIHVSQAGAGMIAPWLLSEADTLGKAVRAAQLTPATTTPSGPT